MANSFKRLKRSSRKNTKRKPSTKRKLSTKRKPYSKLKGGNVGILGEPVDGADAIVSSIIPIPIFNYYFKSKNITLIYGQSPSYNTHRFVIDETEILILPEREQLIHFKLYKEGSEDIYHLYFKQYNEEEVKNDTKVKISAFTKDTSKN